MKIKTVGGIGVIALGLVILATGCSTSGPTISKKELRTENLLSLSGFRSLPVTTPQQMQQCRSLPPGKISIVQRNGAQFFVYPAAAQNCVFVGQEAQFQAYQNNLSNAEENRQYDKISKMDPSVAKYNNQAEILSGNVTISTADWDSVWGP